MKLMNRFSLVAFFLSGLFGWVYLRYSVEYSDAGTMRRFLAQWGSSEAGDGANAPPPVPHHSRPIQPIQPRQSGRRSVGYFTNWGIYDRQYLPSSLPIHSLTHVNYAFANVQPDTGTVVLTDPWADIEIHHDDEPWEEGRKLYGNFAALYRLKRINRNLKILLSIGGYSYRSNFACLTDPRKRTEFGKSAVRLVQDLGLDGLDIDWEYPQNRTEAAAYTDLLRTCRAELDTLARSKNRPPGTSAGTSGAAGAYELTVAVPCGPAQREVLDVPGMDGVVSFWNLMAYDFAGGWDSVSDHQSNLYSRTAGGISVDDAVRFYLGRGVDSHKLVVGIPLYGRSFMATHGIGRSFNGIGPGSWEDGNWDYKALPLPGSQAQEDQALGATWSFEPSNGRLITYDTPALAHRKAQYIDQNDLGGAMFWELSGDKPIESGQSIVHATVAGFQGGLERRENELDYRASCYENLASGRI